MEQAPYQELHLFFAKGNDDALILRRAKRRQFQLISWDRQTDHFVPGQWIKREVLPQYCSLSPDGKHFMYAVYDGRLNTNGSEYYTAISRPPFFTALALFPNGDSLGPLGGRFFDSQHFLMEDQRAQNICSPVLKLQQVVEVRKTKSDSRGLRLLDGTPLPRRNAAEARLETKTDAINHYDTLGGRLFKRVGMELELLADFSDMQFEEVLAPYDEGIEPAEKLEKNWHPLEGDEP